MDTYDRIEQLMLKHGEKASDLAKATGMSTGLLSQWKSRMQKPSAAKLSKVAAHYDVTTDYLLIGEQKEKFPAKNGQGSKDRDIRRIERARRDMSPDDKERMMKILELSFEEYFSPDYKDDDLNE